MRILLAYDGSAGADVAVSLATALAWPAEATFRVVSVIEPIVTSIGAPWQRPALSPEVDTAITEYAHEITGRVVERLARMGGSVEGTVLRGRPASVIADQASDLRADLILVGSRGHGGIASLVLGSVASEVVDQAPCPVMVVRKPTVSRIVFATDESVAARAAESILRDWSIFDRQPIHVVSVAEVVRPWATGLAPTFYGRALEAYAADLQNAQQEHGRIATDAAARLGEEDRPAEAEVRDGDAAAQIIAAADDRGADLIVVGSRGHTGLTRLVLGSVARNVLSGSTASVLVVKALDQGQPPESSEPR